MIESGNWLVFRLAALVLAAIIGEGALIWYEAWRRLLEVGGASRGLAFCMSTLTVILVVSLFVVGVWEAVMRLATWSQGRTRPSWLVVTGIYYGLPLDPQIASSCPPLPDTRLDVG